MDELKNKQLLKNFEKRRKTINDELSRIKKLLLDKDVHEISFIIHLEMKPNRTGSVFDYHLSSLGIEKDQSTKVSFMEKVEKHFSK